jgi:hypothetical protein
VVSPRIAVDQQSLTIDRGHHHNPSGATRTPLAARILSMTPINGIYRMLAEFRLYRGQSCLYAEA